MRFEIGKGGALVIVVGLLGLSAAVFALGLIAGQEVARQNEQDSEQVATVMAAPSPPAVEPTPALHEASVPPAPVAASTHAPAPLTPPAPANVAESSPPPAKSPLLEKPEPAPPPRPSTNLAKKEITSGMKAAPDSDEGSESDEAPEEAPPAHGHKFNIQVDAVMDRDGADQMVQRLQALGYPSYEVGTTVNGTTWYRVRVGPYDSADEAKAAEQRLHEQYRSAYSTH